MAASTIQQVVCWLSLITVVLAQGVHMDIPWIESVVSSCTSEYAPYFTYHGGHGQPFQVPATTTQHPIPSPTASACSYWMEDIKHQGIAAFNGNASYQVFRNVKDFGAVGDGIHDDTGTSHLRC